MSRFLSKSRIVVTFSILMVAALLAGPSMAFAQPAGTPEVMSEPLTILLMVSDAGEGEEIDAGAADVIAVVHLNPDQQACRALNILPNTRVEIEGAGNTRINQALSEGGVEGAAVTVEDFLGIDIDHYGVISLEGIATAIDAVGGITIVNDTAFSTDGQDFPAGEITLSGEQAILYARHVDDPSTMQGRLDRQKTLVQGVISTLGAGDLGANLTQNIPAEAQASVADIQDHILTDINLPTVLAVANAYSNCVPSEETVETIPFVASGALLDDVTQTEEVSGATDPAAVQAHADWLINGTQLP